MIRFLVFLRTDDCSEDQILGDMIPERYTEHAHAMWALERGAQLVKTGILGSMFKYRWEVVIDDETVEVEYRLSFEDSLG